MRYLLYIAIFGMPWLPSSKGPAAPGGGGDVVFVTGQSLGSTVGPIDERGMKITIGAAPITVTEVGIYGVAGAPATLIVYLRSSTGTSLGSATVTWGTGAQYYFAALGTPVVLSASTVYYVVTEALVFTTIYGSATTVTTTAVATVNDAVNGQPPVAEGTGAGHTYGPVNFKYHL